MIESGKTLRDIANDTGISRAALNNYANDKAEIGINNVVKLAKYFNVSADYLLGLSDAKTNDKELQAICDFVGLSNNAVEALTERKKCFLISRSSTRLERRLRTYFEEYIQLYNRIQSEFISSVNFTQIIDACCINIMIYDVLKQLDNQEITYNCSNNKDNIEFWLRTADNVTTDGYSQSKINSFNVQDYAISFLKECSKECSNRYLLEDIEPYEYSLKLFDLEEKLGVYVFSDNLENKRVGD